MRIGADRQRINGDGFIVITWRAPGTRLFEAYVLANDKIGARTEEFRSWMSSPLKHGVQHLMTHHIPLLENTIGEDEAIGEVIVVACRRSAFNRELGTRHVIPIHRSHIKGMSRAALDERPPTRIHGGWREAFRVRRKSAEDRTACGYPHKHQRNARELEGSRQFYKSGGARLTLPGNSAEERKSAARRRYSTIGREIVTDFKRVLT